MAKFLYGKVTVLTLELDAESEKEATEILDAARLKGERGDDIRQKVYKLGWTEFDGKDLIESRNRVLQEFLTLMQSEIPGYIEAAQKAVQAEHARIIQHPFSPLPHPPAG
jgi:hypothetical protein